MEMAKSQKRRRADNLCDLFGRAVSSALIAFRVRRITNGVPSSIIGSGSPSEVHVQSKTAFRLRISERLFTFVRLQSPNFAEVRNTLFCLGWSKYCKSKFIQARFCLYCSCYCSLYKFY